MNEFGRGPLMPSPPPTRRRWWLLVVLTVVVPAIYVLVDLWTFDIQVSPARVLGPIWTADAGDGPRLYYLMEEERRQRRIPSYARRRYWFTVSYSVFTLRARDARTGEAAGVAELARIDNAVFGQGPEILGPQGGVLWLWNEGAEARDLQTMQPVFTTETLKELNPEPATLLPVDRQYYKVLGTLKLLVFKGRDARYFQVDADSGKIEPLDDATLGSYFHTNKADDAFTYLYPDSDSLSSTSVSGLMWNSLTHGRTWYALLSDEERADLLANPGDAKAPWREAARSLYRGTFELEHRPLLGRHEILLDLATVTPVGDTRFLMGGFLRRSRDGNVWPVGDGTSYLVLHKNALGNETPWYVTRLGLDGSVHWSCSTGLADLHHVCDGGGTAVFTGFADNAQPTRKRPDLFVYIDELTGDVRTLNLVSNEISVDH